MDLMTIVKTLGEFGMGIVAVAAILFMSWRLLIKGEKVLDRVMNEAAADRERAADLFKRLAQVIDEHTAQAKVFHDQSTSAHGFQREEHKDMICNLRDICSSMKEQVDMLKRVDEDRGKEHREMIKCLVEIQTALGRINGYHK